MSKIDPELKKKLLKESQNPFKGLRRTLWVAFTGSAFLGLLIMISKIAGGMRFKRKFINTIGCLLSISSFVIF